MLLSLEDINKYFGDKDLLNDVNITMNDQDKIGVIGVNGAGKTTLINMICGLIPPDSGKIVLTRGKKIGFLQQNSGLDSDNTIRSEVKRAFSKLIEIESRMKVLEKAMGEITGDELESVTKEYAKLATFFEQQDGYNIDYQIKRVLNGMGFADKQMETQISTLSGGEKTRLALAKLLLEKPDLLILDEPTNHLDFSTIEWLEDYLNEYNRAVLIISHDRYFLDRTINAIWEIENKKVSTYKGNYSKYIVLKEELVTRQLKEYDAQQIKIASLEEFVAKNLVRASTTKRAQSRQKELDKMERIDKPILHKKKAKLAFTFEKETGNEVLNVSDLTLQVDENVLCKDINFEILRGDKMGVIGVNGAGKSTLLKTLKGDISVKVGRIVWGKNVVMGYYDQEHLSLTPSNTLLNELWDRFPRLAEQQIRTALGSVGLTGESVFKKVKVISGGEKAKLLFAILMLSHPNVMLLDEPTNHLDLDTKEVLEKALMEYEGTIIVVSHDRYFLNRVPNKIGHLDRNSFKIINGNYEDFTKSDLLTEEIEVAPKKEEPKDFKSKDQKREEAQRRKRINELENLLEEMDKGIEDLELSITLPEIYSDYQLMQDKCKELEELKSKQADLFGEWESLIN